MRKLYHRAQYFFPQAFLSTRARQAVAASTGYKNLVHFLSQNNVYPKTLPIYYLYRKFLTKIHTFLIPRRVPLNLAIWRHEEWHPDYYCVLLLWRAWWSHTHPSNKKEMNVQTTKICPFCQILGLWVSWRRLYRPYYDAFWYLPCRYHRIRPWPYFHVRTLEPEKKFRIRRQLSHIRLLILRLFVRLPWFYCPSCQRVIALLLNTDPFLKN